VKQVEVTILGQGYILGCAEGGEERLQAAVVVVDREMRTIRDAGKVKTRERIALLAALKLAEALNERPAPAAASETGNPNGDVDGADLDGLIKRIDAALGDDGHLI
jgi:cell division protein ZapA